MKPCKLRRSLAECSTQRPNLFIDPSDHMAFELLVDGSWDQFLTDSIKMVSAEYGYSLFIDIGANTGLISVQVAESSNWRYNPGEQLSSCPIFGVRY